jgi:hypothetical protein
MAPIIDETQRTTALAFWRYAHDYLRVARTLADQHKIRGGESQVVYHLAAQGLEFALKSFLRAKGMSPTELRTDIGHSLVDALEKSAMLGLPPLPEASRACIEALAPHHQQRRFTHLDTEPEQFADVRGFVDHHAAPASPPAAEFIQRLRADLVATADGIS